MNNQNFLTTKEYAQKNKISKMQVTRLIKQGKISAEKVGNQWLIKDDSGENSNQIAYEKTTSLQQWNKIIEKRFKKSLDIEKSKDRELIYSRLYSLGLPHERCIAFGFGKFPDEKAFQVAVGRLGFPYWISAVPNPKRRRLNRLSKLRIYDIKTGWNFINKLPEKEKNYKIIVSQYADDPDFKGTALVSPGGNGIVEFVTGDRHWILTRGFIMTDPMIFDQKRIIHFSKTISRAKQNKLYHLLRGIYGHLEFQYGTIEGKKSITFFDYNEEEAYVEIDELWQDLVPYLTEKKDKSKNIVWGLPTSSGKAEGKCVVLHHESIVAFNRVEKGDIIVSDTTTPEMTNVMSKASAIVTDLGGVTSHAAIVCRELGIPAIVGCVNATERIRTGNILKVDADKGKVEILEKK